MGEVGPGVAGGHGRRGWAFGDFEKDGDIDIMNVNPGAPPSLLRNDVSGNNHWLKVKLIGTKSNRSAIGARVVVKAGDTTQSQELMSQYSFLSSNDPRLHFGLGAATKAEIGVRWPNGDWQNIGDRAADQLITVKEGVGGVANVGWTRPSNK